MDFADWILHSATSLLGTMHIFDKISCVQGTQHINHEQTAVAMSMINFTSTHINPRNRELLGKDRKEKGVPATPFWYSKSEGLQDILGSPLDMENIPCPRAGSRTLTLYCFGAGSPGWCYGLPWWLFYPCSGSAPWRRYCAGCSVWECLVWKRRSASHGRHS